MAQANFPDRRICPSDFRSSEGLDKKQHASLRHLSAMALEMLQRK
jgi:hypothetical protein